MTGRKKHDHETLPTRTHAAPEKTRADVEAEFVDMHRADMRKRALDEMAVACTSLEWLAAQDDDAGNRHVWRDAAQLVRMARRYAERLVIRDADADDVRDGE